MVKVRVISNQSIYIGDDYSSVDKTKYPVVDRVIVQIHGGGFIAMSSYSYQPFAREWVKKTRSAMFCIDYGLAPERPYPNAIEDVWQAYYWIMTQAHNYMNVQPKHVVVIGDSAGGNLAAALALKCIREGMPAPKLLLCYPGIDLISPESQHGRVFSFVARII
jgi:hormone-sensitive lipase